MKTDSPVIVVGATGRLGQKIVSALAKENANVRCLVRSNTSTLPTGDSIEIRQVDFSDETALARACEGGTVVVSALSGLDDVIIDLQSRVLAGARAAGVPRFIPSDYSIDYRPLHKGENRNLNLRQAFMRIVDDSGVRATSIVNGAFAEMLTGQAPFILFKIRRVLCWGHPDQLMDFTTMDNAAEFTARAALDSESPRFLKIAGDQISANGLAAVMTELTNEKYKVLRPGGSQLFKGVITLARLASREPRDLYPAWQGMQYMRNMYDGHCKLQNIDNERYAMKWTTAKDVLSLTVSS